MSTSKVKTNCPLDIKDRAEDYKSLSKEIRRLEHGVRAVCAMYDDHSDDRKSYEEAYRHRDNIYYRLRAAGFHHGQLINQVFKSEDDLMKVYKTDRERLTSVFPQSPYIDDVENKVSFLFDSIVFHVSSIFDYLAHIVCYMSHSRGARSLYWPRLRNIARSKYGPWASSPVAAMVDLIDRELVTHLYDYRSRLLHTKRDAHHFKAVINLHADTMNVIVSCSDDVQKHFKLVKLQYPAAEGFTILFMSSWLIRETMGAIERVLDSLASEILARSTWHENMARPKRPDGFMLAIHDQKTRTARPVSESLWRDFKEMPKSALDPA